MTQRREIEFTGTEGNRLVGDVVEPPHGDGRVALLLHGGGQTRHAWRGTQRRLAEQGITSITYDQRGHGDSVWPESGNYRFDHYAGDLLLAADAIERRFGRRPVLIGASLGGLAGILAEGEAERPVLSAIVLVDVTPRMDMEGVDRVLGFMGERSREGFASVEEAAEAVAAYLPHRPRPASLAGLQKNLRRGADGRWRWHWDPRFLDGPRHDPEIGRRLIAAAGRLRLPALLVRGRMSELVREEHWREFQALVPHAEMADVAGAGHMVAGDRNDVFAAAVIAFLRRMKAG